MQNDVKSAEYLGSAKINQQKDAIQEAQFELNKMIINGLYLELDQMYDVTLMSVDVQLQSCSISNICRFQPSVRCMDGLNVDDVKLPFQIAPVSRIFQITPIANRPPSQTAWQLKIEQKADDVDDDDQIIGSFDQEFRLPEQFQSQSSVCMRLSFGIKPQISRATLEVISRSEAEDKKEQVVYSSNQNDNLRLVVRSPAITLRPSNQTTFLFRVSGSGRPFTVMINRVALSDGECPAAGSCDFSTGNWCGYKSRSLKNSNWFIGRPQLRNANQVHNYSLVPETQAYFDLTGLNVASYSMAGPSVLLGGVFISPNIRPVRFGSVRFRYSMQGQSTKDENPRSVETRFEVTHKDHYLFTTSKSTPTPKLVCVDVSSEVWFTLQLNIFLEFMINTENPAETAVPYFGISMIEVRPDITCSAKELYQDAMAERDDDSDSLAEQNVNCAFDENFCDWTNSHWKLSRQVMQQDLPSRDVDGKPIELSGVAYFFGTLGDYAFLRKMIKVNDQKAHGTQFCLRFASFVSPQADLYNSLHIKIGRSKLGERELKAIFPTVITSKHYWLWQYVDLTSNEDFELILMAKISFGVVAIQQLSLHAGKCHSTLSNQFAGHFHCDFEQGMCDFHPISGKHIEFIHSSYLKIHQIDHTYGWTGGETAIVLVPSPLSTDESTELVHDLEPNKEGYCVRFWIQSQLDGVFELRHDQVLQPLVRVSQKYLRDVYYPFQANIEPAKYPIDLRFMFHYKANSIGSFAIDDVYIEPGSCPSIHRCDFEQACLWDTAASVYLQKKMNFELRQKSEWFVSYTKAQLALKDDQLYMHGHYLIYDDVGSSYPYRSPILDTIGKDKFCLHISHRTIDTPEAANLRIWAATPDSSDPIEIETILSSSSSKNRWNRYQKTFDIEKVFGQSVEQLVIYIQAVPPTSNKSLSNEQYRAIHIHLDNLLLGGGQCGSTQRTFQCGDENHTQLYDYQVCNHQVDCPNGADELNCIDCPFSRSLCGYRDESADSKLSIWRLSPTMPNVHNQRKPFDLNRIAAVASRLPEYLNLTGRTWLRGPLIRMTHSMCQLELSFITFNAQLSLLVQGEMSESIQMWKNDYPTMYGWQTVKIDVGYHHEDVRFIFELQATSKADSSVALSDVKSTGCGPLRANSTADQCSPGQFRCENGRCISTDLVCDLQNDCGDYTDEKHCAFDKNRCDFEDGLCEWSVEKIVGESEQFVRTRPHNDLDMGPTRDRTRNRRSGHYVLFNNAKKPRWNHIKAEMRGVHVDVQPGCSIRLFYMMRGSKLRVILRDLHGQPEIAYEIDVVRDYNWNRAQIDLYRKTESVGDYRVTIEGELYASNDFVALDDITFSPECYAAAHEMISCDFGIEKEPFCNWNSYVESPLVKITSSEDQKVLHPWIPNRSVNGDSYINYVAIESKSINQRKVRTKTIDLYSPIVVWPGDHMYMHLNFFQWGTQVGSILIIDKMNSNELLYENNQSFEEWRSICIPFANLKHGKKIQLQISILLPSDHVTVALSDLKVNDQACPTSKCTFDSDNCPLMPTSSGINSWKRSLVPTQFKDHTWQSNRGGFLYADSINEISKQAVSGSLTSRLKHCIRFWHARFEQPLKENEKRDQGEFIVSSEFTRSAPFFRSTQMHANIWRKAVINLQHQRKEKFSMSSKFVGSGGNLWLAIDDLEVLSGACSVIDCAFDQNVCEWSEKDYATDSSWIRVTGQQLEYFNNPNLPSKDVSCLSPAGGMLWTHFENSVDSAVASMISGEFWMDKPSLCLQMSVYFPVGANVCFKVLTVDSEKSVELQSITSNKFQADRWTEITFNVPQIHQLDAQYIKLLAFKTPSGDVLSKDRLPYTNSIAVDSINLRSQPCEYYERKLNQNTDMPITTTQTTLQTDDDYNIDVLHKDGSQVTQISTADQQPPLIPSDDEKSKTKSASNSEEIVTQKQEENRPDNKEDDAPFVDPIDDFNDDESDRVKTEDSNTSGVEQRKSTSTDFQNGQNQNSNLDDASLMPPPSKVNLWKLFLFVGFGLSLMVISLFLVKRRPRPQSHLPTNLNRETSSSKIWFVKNEELSELY